METKGLYYDLVQSQTGGQSYEKKEKKNKKEETTEETEKETKKTDVTEVEFMGLSVMFLHKY